MKNGKVILILLGIIIAALAFTNPSEQEHKDAVKAKVEKSMQDAINEKTSKIDNKWGDLLGKTLGSLVGNKFTEATVNELVSRENYVLCSLTQIKWNGEKNTVGVGILGKVFVSDKLETIIQDYTK